MLNFRIKDAVPTVFYAFPPMETMGDRIRRLRVAKNYTQEQFGKLVGVSKSAVSQWEDGSTKNIKLVPFLKAVDVLGTDVLYLIHGDSRAPTGASSPSGSRLRVVRKPSGT